MKISGLILSWNSEKCLEKTIENINDYVDELVVIDSGSIDDTKEIAEEYGATVFILPILHNGDLINCSIRRTFGDWILLLNAGEVFETEFCSLVKELTEQDEYDSFSFIVKEFVNGEFITETRSIRFFRRYLRAIQPVDWEIVGSKKTQQLDYVIKKEMTKVEYRKLEERKMISKSLYSNEIIQNYNYI